MHDSLRKLSPKHEFFAGIDSDGCVFDSMEVKQKEFFIPLALEHFNLYPVAEILRKTWDHVNLYSINRGSNRFLSFIRVFDLLSSDELVRRSGVKLPDTSELRRWVSSERKLGNENLRKYFESHSDPSLEKILLWSEDLNREISLRMRKIPPFSHVRAALEEIASAADIVIISQTPYEALEKEWRENDLVKYVSEIAGQEHGTKQEQIAAAAVGKYDFDKILMIGDAKGDLDAALANGVLFYPVIPGREDESWEKLVTDGFARFKKGTFYGEYQETLIRTFLASLPE
jgi:phosphoglycolate phosphatase-like HAD superfamily hydrolase